MNRPFLIFVFATLLFSAPVIAMVNKAGTPARTDHTNNPGNRAPAWETDDGPLFTDGDDNQSVRISQAPDDEKAGERQALISMILGVCSLVFFVIGIFIGPFAIVVGSRALKKLQFPTEEQQSSRRQAVAGIVMGTLAILGSVLLFMLLLLL